MAKQLREAPDACIKSNLESTPKTISLNELTFEVVDSVPSGYMIWNIGHHMVDGYLPLCRLSRCQPFPGGGNIETDTLKAIRIEGAQTILSAVGGDLDTIEKMEQFLRSNRKAKPGSWEKAQIERIKRALPIMRQIKWN